MTLDQIIYFEFCAVTGCLHICTNNHLFSEMNFDDFNHISSSRWGQFNVRNADCEALDKLQEEFDWYNFGITNGDEDSMVESTN